MSKRFKFTNTNIKALPYHNKTSPASEAEYSDTEIIGLKLLIGKSGSKRFLLRYTFQSTKKSIAIGRFGDIDINDARKIARQHKLKLAEGIDPKQERDSYKSQPTLSHFFYNTYLPYIKQRKRSWAKDQQRFVTFIEPILGRIRYSELTSMHVQQFQLDISNPDKMKKTYAPATCNRILAVLKTMTSYAVKMGIVESNAALPISLFRENNERTRFFDINDSKRIIQEARKYPNVFIGSAIALLFICGNRKSELFNAKWEHLNRSKCTLYIPITKSGKPRFVYMSDLAMDIIESIPKVADNPYIFAGRVAGRPIAEPRTAYKKILKNAGITDLEGVCFHTARHSVASNMVSSGMFNLNDVKAQLGHASIQSSERYAKLTIEHQRRTSEGIASLLHEPNSHPMLTQQ